MMIDTCHAYGKGVIMATQMMYSMKTNIRPTNAEVTDVANAVFDGTSAIMLSGETAIGAHPAHVVSVMAKIAEQAEADAFEMNTYNGIKYDMSGAPLPFSHLDIALSVTPNFSANSCCVISFSILNSLINLPTFS